LKSRQLKVFIFCGLLAFFSVQLLNTGRIEHLHTDREATDLYWRTRVYNDVQLRKAAALVKAKPSVIFNCGSFNHIPLMFYSGQVAYPELPDSSTISRLKKENVAIVIFDDGRLPAPLPADPEIQKLKVFLIRNAF
jgi:hypothetical protein